MLSVDYLAGMFDGEGSISGDYSWMGTARAITISNTDYALLEECRLICVSLGIRSKISGGRPPSMKEHHKTCFNLNIYDQNSMRLFLQHVPIRSAAKRAKLEYVVSTFGVTRSSWLKTSQRSTNVSSS